MNWGIIIDYHFTIDCHLTKSCKIIFAGYMLSNKMSDTWYKFCFRDIQGILQQAEDSLYCIIIIIKSQTMKKCFHTDQDINLALSQISSTLMGPRLQSPTKFLPNRPIRGLLPKTKRHQCYVILMMIIMQSLNNDNKCIQGQRYKDFTIIPVGATVVVQGEDRGPWMHSTVVEHANQDQRNKSYKIYMTKTRGIINRTAHHIRQTSISTEQYLCNEMTKAKHQSQHNEDFHILVSACLLAYANASYTESCRKTA